MSEAWYNLELETVMKPTESLSAEALKNVLKLYHGKHHRPLSSHSELLYSQKGDQIERI